MTHHSALTHTRSHRMMGIQGCKLWSSVSISMWREESLNSSVNSPFNELDLSFLNTPTTHLIHIWSTYDSRRNSLGRWCRAARTSGGGWVMNSQAELQHLLLIFQRRLFPRVLKAVLCEMFYLLVVFCVVPRNSHEASPSIQKIWICSSKSLSGITAVHWGAGFKREETCPWRFTLKITLQEGWLAGLQCSISRNTTVIFLFNLPSINSIKIESGQMYCILCKSMLTP